MHGNFTELFVIHNADSTMVLANQITEPERLSEMKIWYSMVPINIHHAQMNLEWKIIKTIILYSLCVNVCLV